MRTEILPPAPVVVWPTFATPATCLRSTSTATSRVPPRSTSCSRTPSSPSRWSGHPWRCRSMPRTCFQPHAARHPCDRPRGVLGVPLDPAGRRSATAWTSYTPSPPYRTCCRPAACCCGGEAITLARAMSGTRHCVVWRRWQPTKSLAWPRKSSSPCFTHCVVWLRGCVAHIPRVLCVVETGTYEKWHRHVPHSVKSVEQLPHWGAEASWMNACVQQPNCPGRVSMCYPTIPPRQ